MNNLDQEYSPNSIRTFTGKCFDVIDLKPNTIDVRDIAHALSHTARFAGQTFQFLSVAQHSVMVSEMVSERYALAALLHDASEAYLGDMPSPFKKLLPDYRMLEQNVMNAIATKFGFEMPLHPSIKKADKEILQMEWDDHVIGRSRKKYTWTPLASNIRFMQRFKELTR